MRAASTCQAFVVTFATNHNYLLLNYALIYKLLMRIALRKLNQAYIHKTARVLI